MIVPKASYYTMLGCMLLGIPPALQAQLSARDSLHSMADNRVIDVFGTTQNPATLASLPLPAHGYAKTAAFLTHGDFRRPMEPGAATVLSIAAGGWQRVKEWGYRAAISYNKYYERNLAWSSVYNPYTANPLIWADSSTGKWQRDHIDATVSMVTPVWLQRGHAGLTVDYAVGSGARTNEPKPFYRVRNIALLPGITWQLNMHSEWGIAGKAAFVQEDNEIGFYSNSPVKVYRLRGYGTYKPLPFITAERKRKGTDLQAAVHYLHQAGNRRLLISGYIGQQEESVTEGVAKTETTGYFTAINMGATAMLYKGTAGKGRSLQLQWRNSNGYIDDAIFRAESASFQTHTVTLQAAAWYPGSRQRSSLQWTLTPAFHFADHTDQATVTQFSVTRLGADLQLNYRRHVGKYLHWQLQPMVGYHHVADEYFTNQVMNVIIRQLVMPDYAMMTTSYYQAGLAAAIEWQPAGSLAHVLSAQAMSRLATEQFNDRTQIQFSYSIIF